MGVLVVAQFQPNEAEIASITNIIGSKLHVNYNSSLRLLQSPTYRHTFFEAKKGREMEEFLRRLDYIESVFLIKESSADACHKIGNEMRDEGITHKELDGFQETLDSIALRVKVQFPTWLRDSSYLMLYGAWAIGPMKTQRPTTWAELDKR